MTLEKELGYEFMNKELLRTALTHSSYANENRGGAQSYERLEFFGDSILGFVTAGELYFSTGNAEGELTKLRAQIVCEQNLAAVARGLGLGQHVLLGRGEDNPSGRERPSILADIVEAIIGAIYIDGGVENARAFVKRHILSPEVMTRIGRESDFKTELQEFVQRDRTAELRYRLIGEWGPDHDKTFEAEALVNGAVVGRGKGRSKKEAEQEAARAAVRSLKK